MASSSSYPHQNAEHHALLMPSSSSARKRRPFSGIEPPHERRKVSESTRSYDVFINHRGPDVKSTLALELYKSLEKLNIRAFLDSEEKELGDSFPSIIETAIHSAAVHIAIFSKGYAESAWCLEELVLMLQTKAKIIPVFYDVNPSALRHIEKGVYGEAFAQYQEKGRYMEKLEEWKVALQSVSFIAGVEFHSSGDCENIVSVVKKEIERTRPITVAKYPVGLSKLVQDFEKQCIEKAVQEFERRCEMNIPGEDKAKIIGIFGMGGVGKTTLCKELFNRERSAYKRSSFLFDVREASAKCNLPCLQMKLLRDLFNDDRQWFTGVEDGANCLRSRIRRSRISHFLIVVDDIDHLEQLNALCITDMVDTFSNCLVLVTTRDVGVLINAGITVGYHLKGMEKHGAKELFCWHAFGQPYPRRGYNNLVDLFVHFCHGLPLSIQVLGNHVHGHDREFWELELEKVKKVLPHDILKSLRISIDTLDNEEKQIFMDVACFFIGESTTKAIRIWEASGWSSKHALRRLKNKCLVEEISESEFRGRFRIGHLRDSSKDMSVLKMHDHLRDLGREMAYDVSNPRRLWRSQDLQSLESKGFKNIITQHKFRCLHSFTDSCLGFHIKFFLGESNNALEPSTDLLWLELEAVNTDSPPLIPPWIPLQNLQCLNIFEGRSGGGLMGLWQNYVQAPFFLKELVIHEVPKLRQLRLNFLGCLEKLEICDCISLERVTAISDHIKLAELNIRGCGALELQELSMDNLRCLEVIRIEDFKYLRSLTGLSDLTKLVELSISNCRALELQELSLGNLCCLKIIRVHYCKYLRSLTGLSDLPNLIIFEIRYCETIEELSFLLLSSLKRITIEGCGVLKSMTGISDLTSLETLYISFCVMIEELSLVRLTHLTNCYISCVPMLKRIEVKGCVNLENIDGMIWNLAELDIYDCPEHLTMADKKELYLLGRLQLFNCSKRTIWNCIIDMKKVPSEFIKIIGRAVDGVESTLNANLFWGFRSANSIIRIGVENTCIHVVSAIIFCGVVRVNSFAAAKTMNEFMKECDCSPWLKFDVRPGKWIITSVTMRRDDIKDYIVNNGCCFPFDYLCFEDVSVKTVSMPVMKGEEDKLSNMLCRIVSDLYES